MKTNNQERFPHSPECNADEYCSRIANVPANDSPASQQAGGEIFEGGLGI
jgi:hypothetical protein